MENYTNIIISILHLNEISDLLIDIEPEVSYVLLNLAKKLIDAYKIPEEKINEAEDIVKQISNSCSN